MIIKILGTGCPKCRNLENHACQAVAELGIDAQVLKVTDISKIMEYNVMITPGLVINEKVRATGKLLSPAEIKKLIQQELGAE
ncbi:MAG: thioredoxin family protein [Bacillota bacterium]